MLQSAIQGSTFTEQEITWTRDDGLAQDLTASTLTGTIRVIHKPTTERSITGTLTITDATNGIFTWDYSTADVADCGNFQVQFKADYTGEFDQTRLENFLIEESIFI